MIRKYLKIIFLSAAFLLLVSCAADVLTTGAIEADLQARNAKTLLGVKRSAEIQSRMLTVNQAIGIFRAEHGRNPAYLNELIEKRYLYSLPELPQGCTYTYDFRTGQVGWQLDYENMGPESQQEQGYTQESAQAPRPGYNAENPSAGYGVAAGAAGLAPLGMMQEMQGGYGRAGGAASGVKSRAIGQLNRSVNQNQQRYQP